MDNPSVLKQMVAQFPCNTIAETRFAVLQSIQELTLLALSRADFFSVAAFYGGTALRMFYDLPRFSEDLDFSLLKNIPDFALKKYLPKIEQELSSFGLEMEIKTKDKNSTSSIQSAFIKGNTLVHILKVSSLKPPISGIPPNQNIKIRIEIDIDPPAGADFEIKHRTYPVAFPVRLYDLPSLFAGKIHALLCRNWQTRIKGRDFYDYLWYLNHEVPVNLIHLEHRMEQSGHWSAAQPLTILNIQKLLASKLNDTIIQQAKTDVLPYVRHTQDLNIWSKEFFLSITQDKLRAL